MPAITGQIRSLARSHAASAIRTLAHIMAQGESEMARIAAADKLLDRAYGKAPQAITGADGEGDVRVIIRHIVRGVTVDERPMIDVSPSEKLSNP